jgi:hypothetical protein
LGRDGHAILLLLDGHETTIHAGMRQPHHMSGITASSWHGLAGADGLVG